MKNIKVRKGQLGLILAFTFVFAYLAFQCYAFYAFPTIAWTMFAAGYLLNAIVLLFHFNNKQKRKDQTLTISWTVLLAFLPFIGSYFYWIGSNLRLRHKRSLKKDLDFEAEVFPKIEFTSEEEIFKSNLISQNKKVNLGSSIIPLNGGEKIFPELFDEIEKATRFINLEFFILNDGIIFTKLKELLIRKHKEGVKVRILTDFVGNAQVCNDAYKELKKAKIPFVIFNKVTLPFTSGFSNFRNHTKIVVIDNKTAFFGGANIGDDYSHSYDKYGFWQDLHFKVNGDLVDQMNKQFIIDWHRATQEDISEEFKNEEITVVPSNIKVQLFSDGPQYSETTFMNKLIELIDNAKHTIKIITPYVVLPNKLEESLKRAAKRNVEVKLITAGRADKKSAYYIGKYFVEKLVGYGVEVFRMQDIFCHAKMYVVDDEYSIVGTSNLDYRAIFYHYENNYIVSSKDFAVELNKVWNETLQTSYIEDGTFSNWGIIQKGIWIFLKIISPMF